MENAEYCFIFLCPYIFASVAISNSFIYKSLVDNYSLSEVLYFNIFIYLWTILNIDLFSFFSNIFAPMLAIKTFTLKLILYKIINN